MTGRDRLLGALYGRPKDRTPVVTIADSVTKRDMPEEVRILTEPDFMRRIGYDNLQWGNIGLAKEHAVNDPFVVETNGLRTEYERDENGFDVQTLHTPYGSLVSTGKSGHPVKYPVTDERELKILANYMGDTVVREISDVGTCNFQAVLGEIGEDGVYMPLFQPSPVQQLIEFNMGLENFNYFLCDYPDLMEVTMREMHRINLAVYEFSAKLMPYEAFIAIENTSTTLVSPEMYRKYSMGHIRDFSDVMHKYGKKAIIHMCGLVNNLLDEFRETGMDGIHALTEPPIGNCRFERALDVMGDDLIIIGLLNGNVFNRPDATVESIHAELDRVMTPRLAESNFILHAPADGLPTELWKFETVIDWFEKRR